MSFKKEIRKLYGDGTDDLRLKHERTTSKRLGQFEQYVESKGNRPKAKMDFVIDDGNLTLLFADELTCDSFIETFENELDETETADGLYKDYPFGIEFTREYFAEEEMGSEEAIANMSKAVEALEAIGKVLEPHIYQRDCYVKEVIKWANGEIETKPDPETAKEMQFG